MNTVNRLTKKGLVNAARSAANRLSLVMPVNTYDLKSLCG